MVVDNFPDPLHFGEVLLGVVVVNHFVLHSDIVPTENEDLLTSRVVEPVEIVDETINADFIGLEILYGTQTLSRCRLGAFIRDSRDFSLS